MIPAMEKKSGAFVGLNVFIIGTCKFSQVHIYGIQETTTGMSALRCPENKVNLSIFLGYSATLLKHET